MTFDGQQLLIVPTCAVHNQTGKLDSMGKRARLKEFQLYAVISGRGQKAVNKEGRKFVLSDLVLEDDPSQILDMSSLQSTLNQL